MGNFYMKNILIDLPEIGTIKSRSVHEISGSHFTLGCETLDRDFADYEKYKSYIENLGIKTIRLQAGWAKTEKVPGVLDFSWLDKIIFDAKERGLNILLETDYGNPAYEGGGGFDLAGGFPVSEIALTAWDNWVRAMATRYKDCVRDWAMWNEPDIREGRTVEEIVDFNIRTARIIKEIIPDARIGGLSLACPTEKLRDYLRDLQTKNALNLFEWIIYHGYMPNPDDACDAGCIQQRIIREFSNRISLRQGENGCPSERTTAFALAGYDWSELSQSKWDLRRYIGDIAHGVDTAVFTICDFNHIGREINRKGLLFADADHNVLRPKQAYYAIKHMTSIFDDDLVPVAGKAAAISQGKTSAFTFSSQSGKGNLLAYWDRTTYPGDAVHCGNTEIVLHDFPIKDIVLADLISGKIYRVPEEKIRRMDCYTIVSSLPIIDSPFVLAEKSILM